MIREFKVQTGNYDAGYGRGTGANVDLVSESGRNHLHGSAWEFLRNDVLNANDFFAKRNGQTRPVLKQNQFGFAVGGPVRKNSSFFFGGYQGTIQRNGDSSVLVRAKPWLTGSDKRDRLLCLGGGVGCGGKVGQPVD
jgi:serine/threonine-protein kinase RIO1